MLECIPGSLLLFGRPRFQSNPARVEHEVVVATQRSHDCISYGVPTHTWPLVLTQVRNCLRFLPEARACKTGHLTKWFQNKKIIYQFVDEECGEWYGYLNQEGRINNSFKGGPFKGKKLEGAIECDQSVVNLAGCFHVPRALMMCENILNDLLGDKWKHKMTGT